MQSQNGVFVIGAEWLEEIKQDPTPLMIDGTRIDVDALGCYEITAEGPLSAALGLQLGDRLQSLNGLALDEDNIWTTLGALQDEISFSLTYTRGAQTMTLDAALR